MKLLIVESPAKARTLKKLLKNFVVEATIGHIKDLPKNKLGVEIENQFKPIYVILPGKQKIIKKLKTLAKKAEEIYLASDPDREGEAIAWHIAEEIDKKGERQIKRVLFHEITPIAVKEALKNPTSLNSNKYGSQQTRRILDRLVGYKISPLLWEKVKRGLSAGRVQSVALRLICEREKAIQNFVSEEYWEISVLLEAKNPPPFEAKLIKIKDQKCHLKTEDEAKKIIHDLKEPFIVEKITSKEKKKYPPPPFITSTMQQEAAKKLGFSAQKTMFIAQQLYEGIDLPEGRVGLITYMRTDSVRSAEIAIKEARKFIKEKWGDKAIPKNPYFYKNKREAQDAHEAIRPTSVYRTPESISNWLNSDQKALYELIWKRFIASQMAPAIYDQTIIEITCGDYLFKVTGSILKDYGFKYIYEETEDKDKSVILPLLEEGEKLKLKKILPSQHFTKPPARYTEASLIKELEEKGIGRPSTYATILTTIQERKYVVKDKGKFKPTELGFIVNELLIKNFPEIVDVSFTAKMEAELDEIEEGKKLPLETLTAFYEVFNQALKQAEIKMLDVKRKGIETEIRCEKCGAKMIIKIGKNGVFLACSRYPSCKNTKDFVRNENGEIVILTKETEEICPECGRPLIKKQGRYGVFLACSGYPECKYTASVTLNIVCPQCGLGKLVKQISKKKKIFYRCSRYPQCQFILWNEPIAKSCPHCGAAFRILKKQQLVCLKCGYKEKYS